MPSIQFPYVPWHVKPYDSKLTERDFEEIWAEVFGKNYRSDTKKEPDVKKMSPGALKEIAEDLKAAQEGDTGARGCLEAIATEIAARMLYLERNVDDLLVRLAGEEGERITLLVRLAGEEEKRITLQMQLHDADMKNKQLRERVETLTKAMDLQAAKIVAMEYLNPKVRGGQVIRAEGSSEVRIEEKILEAEGKKPRKAKA
jgi:hypothetical protein